MPQSLSADLLRAWLIILLLSEKVPRKIGRQEVGQATFLTNFLKAVEKGLQEDRPDWAGYHDLLSQFLVDADVPARLHRSRQILTQMTVDHAHLVEKNVVAKPTSSSKHVWYQLTTVGQEEAKSYFAGLRPMVQTILTNEITEGIGRLKRAYR